MLINRDERHIQVDDVDVRDIEKVWENLSANYPGFVVDFYFHNTLILFMVDKNDFIQMDAATHLGFRREGYYIAYHVKI